MTDRARQVYALLRTCLAWVRPPTTGTSAEAGFVQRDRPCRACQANGRWDAELRRRVDPGCEFCQGSGRRPVKDPMDDPLKHPPADKRREVVWGGATREAARDADRQRDTTIGRLDQQARVREGLEANPDAWTDAVEGHDRLYQRGSYAELDLALEWLRLVSPDGYRVAMSVAYQPLGEPPVEPVQRVVVAACELLALRMPATIRVPGFVSVWTDDELRRRQDDQARALAETRASWKGRRDARAVENRDQLIRDLAGRGLSVAQIERSTGISRWTVRRVVNRAKEAA